MLRSTVKVFKNNKIINHILKADVKLKKKYLGVDPILKPSPLYLWNAKSYAKSIYMLQTGIFQRNSMVKLPYK